MTKKIVICMMALFLVFGTVMVLAEGTAEGDEYPSRPIKVYVPYSAGGSSDLLARSLNSVASNYFDVPLVIVNKTGGGGTIATEYIINSKPDGYNVLIGYGSGCDLVTPHVQDLPYDPLKDLDPIIRASVHSIDLVVHAESDIYSVDDLVAYAKEQGRLIVSGSTMAGSQHITAAAFAEQAGINLDFIPYGGGGPAAVALAGKQSDAHFGHPSTLIPHIQSGRFRLLATALPERDPVFPDIPTFKELGYNFSTEGSVKGLAVAKGTPDHIKQYLHDKFKACLEDKSFIKMMGMIGQPIMYMGPDEFGVYLKETQDQYGELINRLGLKAE